MSSRHTYYGPARRPSHAARGHRRRPPPAAAVSSERVSWLKRRTCVTYLLHLLICCIFLLTEYPANYVYLPAAHAAHALEEGGNLVRELADVGQLVPLVRLARPAWSGQRARSSFGRAHHAGRESSRAAKCRGLSRSGPEGQPLARGWASGAVWVWPHARAVCSAVLCERGALLTESQRRWRAPTAQPALCLRRRLTPAIIGTRARPEAPSASWSGAASISWSRPFASGTSALRSAPQSGLPGAAAASVCLRHEGRCVSTTVHSTTVEATHSHLARARAIGVRVRVRVRVRAVRVGVGVVRVRAREHGLAPAAALVHPTALHARLGRGLWPG